MKKIVKRTLGSGARNLRSGIEAGVTIAARAPKFFNAGLNPFGADAREAQLAVTEKITAAWDGAIEAQQKLGSLWLRAAFGRLSSDDAALAWLDVCDAATAPARRRVRANAKRLTR